MSNLRYRIRQGTISGWYYVEVKRQKTWRAIAQVRSRHTGRKIVNGMKLLDRRLQP